MRAHRSITVSAPKTLCALAAALALGTAACKPQTPADPSASTVQPPPAATQAEAKDPDQGKTRMTALNGLLLVFAGDTGTSWNAYDGIAGVEWRDARPVEVPEVADPAVRYSRAGRMLLAGFGETDLPDGEEGADAGVRRGNEGESGVTLSGDAERVNEIAVVKFYPSEDYEAVLRGQLPAAAKYALEAEACAGEDSQKNRFYRIDLDGDVFAYVEAFVDEEAGPGSTTFVFTRNRPERRIAQTGCGDPASAPNAAG